MNKYQTRFLYLPIEIWSREFHAKALLALHGVSKGWSVVIGPKVEMHRRLPYLPKGVVLQFGFHKNYATQMKKLRSCGHKVVAADEEGLVTLNREHYKRYRVSSKTLEVCDKCFCWGEVHAEMLREVDRSVDGKLHITGNPRMDLLRPAFRDLLEKQASELRNRYGRFLLINGNFGSFNHAMGIDYTWKSLEVKGWTTTPQDEDFHRRRVQLQGRFFNAFHSVIPKLATAERKVIVRPHPSEPLAPWEALARANQGKVLVVREGSVLPWLQSAEAVLHNGCTTAVEAFILGRPVVAFRPEQDLELEAELPNHISMQANNEEELIDLLSRIDEEDRCTRDARRVFADQYVEGLTGLMASERMVDFLPRTEKADTGRKFSKLVCNIQGRVLAASELVLRMLNRQASAYLDLKCGKLDLEDTRKTIFEYAERLKVQYPSVSSIGNGLLRIR